MAMPDRLPSDFAAIHTDVVAANGRIKRINYFLLRMNQRMNRNNLSLG